MDLTTMRANVAADLDDAGHVTWSTDELDRAIARALSGYSEACPRRAETTLLLSGAGREVDLSSISGLAGVERVWYPYDAGAPDWPPRWRCFELWPDGTLFLAVPEEPAAGESVRIFYWMAHTLDGLGGATETSLPTEDEETVALGAAGFAALEKARGAVGSLQVSGYTPLQWKEWAEGRLAAYEKRLAQAAGRRGLAESGPVQM